MGWGRRCEWEREGEWGSGVGLKGLKERGREGERVGVGVAAVRGGEREWGEGDRWCIAMHGKLGRPFCF